MIDFVFIAIVASCCFVGGFVTGCIISNVKDDDEGN